MIKRKENYYIERPYWELGLVTGMFGFWVGSMFFMLSSLFGGLFIYPVINGALIQGIVLGIVCFLFFSFIEPKKVSIKKVGCE